ncbi:MAG: acylphosphatase [Nitrospiraceae bacterium]
MSELIRARVLVSGIVQGVAFRAFTQRQALRLNLHGGVRNLDDGRVEAIVEGSRKNVDALIVLLGQGPPMAKVERVEVEWSSPAGSEQPFQIWY